MPISRWISWSDKADMMAPLFTLARHAATYHAGIPTHNCHKQQNTAMSVVHKVGASSSSVEFFS